MEYPEKGKDVIATTSDGRTVYVFRCACHNKNCKEWRCSTMGSGMMVDVVEWKYEDDKSDTND